MGPAELGRRANDARATEIQHDLQEGLRDVGAIRAAPPVAAAPLPHADWAPGWRDSTEFEQGRIVNGVTTSLYPAVGALIYGTDAAGAFSKCTGTLVGCHTFVTANHCVDDDRDPHDYFVYFQHAGIFAVSAISPVNTDPTLPFADVAVLTLAKPVSGLRPVGLNHAAVAQGTSGRIVGFGRTGGSKLDFGMKRTGRVVTGACDHPNPILLCWTFEGPMGPPGSYSNICEGDSGGPLFLWSAGVDHLDLVGVASKGSQAECLAGDRGHEVDVQQLASWISGFLGGDTLGATCDDGPVFGSADVRFLGQEDTLFPTKSRTYPVSVPPGAVRLRIGLNGEDIVRPTGERTNLDLYVRHGALPDPGHDDCEGTGTSQYAFCDIENPAPGDWYARVTQNGDTNGMFQISLSLVKGH